MKLALNRFERTNTYPRSKGGSAFCVGKGGARKAGGGHEAKRTAALAQSL